VDVSASASGHTTSPAATSVAVDDPVETADAVRTERDVAAATGVTPDADTSSSTVPGTNDLDPLAQGATDVVPPEADAAAAGSGGSVWAWLLGIVLMAGVAFGAWLLLQPPWKRWRWYWSLRATLRRQWLKYVAKGEDDGKAPRRDSVRLTAGASPVGRSGVPESQIDTMVKKPVAEKPPEQPSKKYGSPLKSRDTTTVRTKRTKVQVVGEETPAAKRKKRQTGVTLPVVPLSDGDANNN
jgi:hypothetical protein